VQVKWIQRQPRQSREAIDAALTAFHRGPRECVPAPVIGFLAGVLRPAVSGAVARLTRYVYEPQACDIVMEALTDMFAHLQATETPQFLTYAGLYLHGALNQLKREEHRVAKRERVEVPMVPGESQWDTNGRILGVEQVADDSTVTPEFQELAAFLQAAIAASHQLAHHRGALQRLFRIAPYDHAPIAQFGAVAAEFGISPSRLVQLRDQLRTYVTAQLEG